MAFLIGASLAMAIAILALKFSGRLRLPAPILITIAAVAIGVAFMLASQSLGIELGIPLAFIIFTILALTVVGSGVRVRKRVIVREGSGRREVIVALSNTRLGVTGLTALIGALGGAALLALLLPFDPETRAVTALLAFTGLWAVLHTWMLAARNSRLAITVTAILGLGGLSGTAFAILQAGAI